MRKSVIPFLLPSAALYFVTFCVLLPYICSDWAFSWFFDADFSKSALVNQALQLNEKRHASANNYFKYIDRNSTAKFYKDLFNLVGVDLAIGVVSVRRMYGVGSLGYLTQVMAKLDALFKNDTYFKRKTLFLCNVYAGPGQHSEAVEMAQFFPIVSRFEKESPSDVIQSLPEKEKYDYIYCLKQAHLHKPKYILIVEDDALAFDNMFIVLHQKLEELQGGSSTEHYHTRNQWLYLKLFYPERWQGFGWEFGRLVELVGYGLFGGLCFIGVCPCIFGVQSRPTSVQKQRKVFGITFFIGFIYFVLVTFTVGRPYLLKWRHFSPFFYRLLSAPDCCSPALVFPSTFVAALSRHLENVTCTINKGLDIASDGFAKLEGLDRHVVEPNLFTHIGLVSTLKGISMWPQEFIYDS